MRAVVMVQRPTDLDTACSLALLQEEVAEGEQLSPPHTTEHRYVRIPSKRFLPPQATTPLAISTRATDNRGLEAARTSTDDKVAALRAYRKAKGACFKCGERWGHEHTCPATVKMHVVEELFALFTSDEVAGRGADETVSEEQETICSISLLALTGVASDSSGVIQLHAYLNDHEILILIDSGSSTSYTYVLTRDLGELELMISFI
uniref:Uncharacterized protein n=1 Tax=Avena sativa TaxID=4498 RepID=A0ACD5YVF2_AVESA